MRLYRSSKRFALLVFALLGPVVSTMAQAEELTIRSIPIWLSYGGTVLLVVIAIRIGFQLGIKQYVLGTEKDPAVLPVSGALMGLLAFMLAFTFNLSMNRFDMRKMQYLDQINAIETFYRRAELFPDKYRTAIQSEMIKYVDVRIEAIRTTDKASGIIPKSYEIHNKLWSILEQVRTDPEMTGALFNLSSNALIDLNSLHNRRVAITTLYYLPSALWAALYVLIAMAMMGMGYLFGTDGKTNWIMVTILALSISAVVILIADLDRSGSGEPSIINFSRQGMIDLKARMVAPGN